MRAFNARYGPVFPEPQAVFSDAPIVKGTDGTSKMSKSIIGEALTVVLQLRWDELRGRGPTAVIARDAGAD